VIKGGREDRIFEFRTYREECGYTVIDVDSYVYTYINTPFFSLAVECERVAFNHFYFLINFGLGFEFPC